MRSFGAKGDGVTDDTAALQAALDAGAGRTVVVPGGTYLVFADGYRDGGRGGLVPRSHTRLVLAPGAVLKAQTTRSTDYVVVRLEGVSHVTIQGGTIQGERDTHLGRDGEWGFGIGIFGASDVVVEDVTVRDCWGDGIFIEEGPPRFSAMPRRIALRRVHATNNRRQGLSVLGVEGLTVVDSVFERTGGTLPSAGVDIEPGGYGHRVRDVTFRDCVFRENAGRGFVADATTGADIADVRVLGGTAVGNGWEGIVFHKATGGALVAGVVVRGNGASGVYLREAAAVTVGGNTVVGNSQRADSAFFGIHVQRSSGITVRDNVVRADEGRHHRYGIALEASRDVTLSGNDLRRSGRMGDLSEDGPMRNALASNRLTGTRSAAGALALPYGPRVAVDAARASEFVLEATDGAPFAIEAPVNGAAGQRLRLHVRNAAGGALGRVSWADGYAIAPWTSPAAGATRTIELVFDGSRWFEVRSSELGP